ncbi:MAG: MMPL family transporter [Spirochaetales bacterium]|nr:MMPL family transporter [Spirochaetales bacterium]
MVKGVEKILTKLIRHRFVVLALTLVLTLFMGWQAVHVEIRADADSLLPEREELLKQFSAFGIPQNEYLVIGVERDNLFELPFLQELDTSLEKLKQIKDIETLASPFSQTAFEKKGAFFNIVSTSDTGRAPENEEELALFKKRMVSGGFTEGLFLSSDETMFLILLEYGDVGDFTVFMNDVESCVAPLRETSRVSISGNPPFEVSAEKYLTRDISIFLTLGIVLILVIYYFGFNSKRSIFLPVLIIISGTVWTIGFMSLVGYAISIVSIVVPPLVLTLGSSYSIHILNSYFRFAHEEVRKDKIWISEAVSSVSSTVLLASITTVVGFLSLLVTSLSQLREFALASSFGILSCSLLSLIVLPCALSLMKNPGTHQTTGIHEGIITRVIKALSHKIVKYRFLFIFIFLAIPVFFYITYPHIKINTDYATYFPKDDPVIQDLNHLAVKMKGFSEMTIVFQGEEENTFLDRDLLEKLNTLELEVMKIEDITSTRSFDSFVREAQFVTRGTRDFPASKGPVLFMSRALNSYREQDFKAEETINGFVNRDYTRYNITFRYYDHETGLSMGEDRVPALLGRIESVLDEYAPEGVTYKIMGPRLFFQDLYNQLNRDLAVSTITAFILIFLVASYTFRSLLYGLLSLVPMFAGVLMNFILMVIFNIPLDLTTVMVSCVSIGIGVDDSIHFLLHYQKDQDLYHTMELTGRPIVLTSLSIVAGIILLLFSTFRPIGYFGVLISIALVNTTLGCLVFLPSFLSFQTRRFGEKKIRRKIRPRS